jgi:predicted enzyme involved in methoxymalonyl-ACP biosynthesis
VLVGRVAGETLEIDVWLMSCRVLKREMELAMFDTLVEQCQARGIRKILGVYIPTKKNAMVAGLYVELGFAAIEEQGGQQQMWLFAVPQKYTAKSSHINRTLSAESAPSASSRA